MDKIERDGKIAVLYSPGYGAGWYTWHDKPELVFDPAVVQMVEENRHEDIPAYVKKTYPGEYLYTGGAEDLRIKWIPKGTRFEITEYDGSEDIRWLSPDNGLVA